MNWTEIIGMDSRFRSVPLYTRMEAERTEMERDEINGMTRLVISKNNFLELQKCDFFLFS